MDNSHKISDLNLVNLPADLHQFFLTYLSVPDLGKLAQVSKKNQEIVDGGNTWENIAHSRGIPFLPLAKKLTRAKNEFKAAIEQAIYPQEFIDLFGSLTEFEALPLLKYNRVRLVDNVQHGFDESCFLLPEQLKGCKIAKGFGIMHFRDESRLTPFLAFCVQEYNNGDNLTPQLDVYILRAERNDNFCLSFKQNKQQFFGNKEQMKGAFYYLKNLLVNKPCQVLSHDFGVHVFRKQFPNDRARVQLTDQLDLENIFNHLKI